MVEDTNVHFHYFLIALKVEKQDKEENWLVLMKITFFFLIFLIVNLKTILEVFKERTHKSVRKKSK